MLHSSFVFAVVAVFSVCGQDLPEYIKPCAKDDPNFKECVIQHATEAIPSIVEGDESFGIPNMKPLKIPEVNVDGGLLKMKLTDCNIAGLDAAEVKDVDMDLDKQHATVTIHIPHLNILGNYDVSGRILVLPISGQGAANITHVNGDYTVDLDWELEERDGEQFAKMSESKLDYNVERAYYHLDNLFNGNKFLGDEMNRFLDENWRGVTKVMTPAVSQTVGKMCNDILNGFLEKIPYSKFFA